MNHIDIFKKLIELNHKKYLYDKMICQKEIDIVTETKRKEMERAMNEVRMRYEGLLECNEGISS